MTMACCGEWERSQPSLSPPLPPVEDAIVQSSTVDLRILLRPLPILEAGTAVAPTARHAESAYFRVARFYRRPRKFCYRSFGYFWILNCFVVINPGVRDMSGQRGKYFRIATQVSALCVFSMRGTLLGETDTAARTVQVSCGARVGYVSVEKFQRALKSLKRAH